MGLAGSSKADARLAPVGAIRQQRRDDWTSAQPDLAGSKAWFSASGAVFWFKVEDCKPFTN